MEDAKNPKRWADLDSPFQANNYNGCPLLDPAIIMPGTGSLVLVSAHGVNHYYPLGGLKVADVFTGGLVCLLGELTGSTVIVNTHRTPEINPYLGTTAAEHLVSTLDPRSIFLDIHGAKDTPDFDLAIGTAFNPSAAQMDICERLLLLAEKHGLRAVINHPNYSAAKRSCLVYRLVNAGFNRSLQIEIVRKYRDPSDLTRANQIISFFTQLSSEITNGL